MYVCVFDEKRRRKISVSNVAKENSFDLNLLLMNAFPKVNTREREREEEKKEQQASR